MTSRSSLTENPGHTPQEPRTPDVLRERLAAIEHEQWEQWSRTVAEQGLTPDRIERWQRFWVPYGELDEATKEHDRVWADKVLAAVEAEAAAHTRSPCQSCGTMEAVLCEECRPEIDVERLTQALHSLNVTRQEGGAHNPMCEVLAADIVVRLTSSENVR